MAWFTRIYSSSLGKKHVMALTGAILGCFLLVHAAGNSSIFRGREAFISYANQLHSLGLLVPLAELTLLAVFLLHVITGLVLFIQNNKARPTRYLITKPAGGRTLASRTMAYSGLTLFVFLLVHLANVHLIDHDRSIADGVITVLRKPLYSVFYSIGVAALGLHTWHGFWSLSQTVGINHTQYNRLVRFTAWIVCGLIVSIFMLIILLVLANSNLLTP